MKNCKNCSKSLPYDSFHKDNRSKDGFRDKCKDCVKTYNKNRFTTLKKICKSCLKNKTTKSFSLDNLSCNKCVAYEEISKLDNIVCKICNVEKGRAEFNKNNNSKLGFSSICKSCKKDSKTTEIRLKNNNRQKEYNKKRFFYTRAYYIINRSKKLKVTVNYSVLELAILLSKKWKEQKGFCKITKVKLDRLNCVVDHIIPISKGGTSDISNLRWLLKDVNRMKGDLEDSYFYDLCFKVCQSKF